MHPDKFSMDEELMADEQRRTMMEENYKKVRIKWLVLSPGRPFCWWLLGMSWCVYCLSTVGQRTGNRTADHQIEHRQRGGDGIVDWL